MAEELKNIQQQESELKPSESINEEVQEKEEAGCLGIGASVLFPIIGIIIYFSQRNVVKNPGAYLWGALAGFIIGIILSAVSGAI